MLPALAVRLHALSLADSPAWNELVRPEIDRQLAAYEASLLASTNLTDRELADQRTRYHALQHLLKELHNTVLIAIQPHNMATEEQLTYSPTTHAKLTSLFSLRPGHGQPLPTAPPVIKDPIQFPASPSFNPFSSPPPPEAAPAASPPV